MECFPSSFFDSLNTVLLSNSYSDLGDSRKTSFFDFSSERVYVKNLKRNFDSYYYLNNVEKSYYEYIYLEGYSNGGLFTASKKKLDFSKTKGDTAEIIVCFEANVKAMSN